MRPVIVRDLMSPNVLAVRPEDDLDAIRNLMERRRVRHVPVVDPNGCLVGLVTHRDLLRHAAAESAEMLLPPQQFAPTRVPVERMMTTDLVTVGPETDIRFAAQTMYARKYGCLPVVDHGRLVGILTESDFVRLFAEGQ